MTIYNGPKHLFLNIKLFCKFNGLMIFSFGMLMK